MEDPKPLTVSELTQAIKNTLEPAFRSVMLQGEVSNFKHQSSGHLYFSLKDAEAQISVVMFRGSATALPRMPKAGDQVIVKGDMNVYPPRGNYQLVIRELVFSGVGELLLKLEQLKKEIHKRGWFSQQHKKPLPKLPKKIGIVTSPTGAAIRDILNVLNRRFAGIHVILNPVRVQGDEAPGEIAQAIRQFNERNLVDVMIVGRGGGSIEDLWAFNEEAVAKAIFESQIPIIAAVGHETDHCIAEYVADVRAPTPSAAAEIVITEKAHQQQNLFKYENQIFKAVQNLVDQGLYRLEGFTRQPVLSSPYALIGMKMQRLDDLKGGLQTALIQGLNQKKLSLDFYRKQVKMANPVRKVAEYKAKFSQLSRSLNHVVSHLFNGQKQKLQSIEQTIRAIDPKNLLKNGYSILFAEKDQSVVTSVKSLTQGQDVRILLADGEAISTIKETNARAKWQKSQSSKKP